MWPLWAAAVSALLLLALPGARNHAVLAPPQSVKVKCGDQRPVVSWSYSSQQPTNFTVFLTGSGRSFSNQTTDHELDLSGFVWSSSTQMFEYLYVTVTAEQGPERSEPAHSLSFSYNRLKAVDITCNLTFPVVNLTGEGAEATLSFENPLHFYKELRTIRHSADFVLEVFTSTGSQTSQCSQEKVCKFSVSLPEDTEPCVNIIGYIKNGPQQINVQHEGPVCAAAPTDGLWVVAILSVVILLFVISLVVFGIWKTRAWVFPKIPPPQTLAPNLPSFRPSLSQSDTVYSQIQITGPRLCPDPESPPGPLHVRDEDRVLFLLEDRPEEDTDESSDMTKTETLSLHSSEPEVEESNYERREQLLEMDVSGDLVTGYTS